MGIFSTSNQNFVTKQLDATLAVGATSLTLSEDVSALFPDTSATHPCTLVIDRVDSNGAKTSTKREVITFTTVSTVTLSGLTRNADSSGSDQEHAVGAVVEFVPDILWAKSMVDNFVGVTDTQTLTNKTLTSPKINENVALTSTATELNLLTGKTTLDMTAATEVEINAGADETKFVNSKQLKESQRLITAYTPAGAGTTTINLALGNIFTVTMPAATQTLAISGATVGQCFLVRINNVTSQGALTWFTGYTIRWAGGTAPTLTGTNAKRDCFGFIVTGASTLDGFVVGQNI
jgi:hypothetical protein